jgi:RNA polymerase sigma-70 factor (sigma-E family)
MTVRNEGFDEFFDAHYPQVVRALGLAFGDRQTAEDTAQEAFARALRRWSSVRGMERPVGWVYVVAMNVGRRAAARRQRDARSESEAMPPAPVDATGTVVTRLALRDALALLPPRQREVVVLRYLADLSVDETADAMRCAKGTVKSTLHAALAALRIELDDDDDEEATTDAN